MTLCTTWYFSCFAWTFFCSTATITSTSFYHCDLIDLRKYNFSELRAIDSQTLPTQTFIQACKDYVSSGFNPVVEACACNGGCATKNVHAKQLKYHVVQSVILRKRNLVQIYRCKLVDKLNDLPCCSLLYK
jgi:hypothetical protein